MPAEPPQRFFFTPSPSYCLLPACSATRPPPLSHPRPSPHEPSYPLSHPPTPHLWPKSPRFCIFIHRTTPVLHTYSAFPVSARCFTCLQCILMQFPPIFPAISPPPAPGARTAISGPVAWPVAWLVAGFVSCGLNIQLFSEFLPSFFFENIAEVKLWLALSRPRGGTRCASWPAAAPPPPRPPRRRARPAAAVLWPFRF